MKMFGLIPKPLRKIFKEVTHYACNSPKTQSFVLLFSGTLMLVSRFLAQPRLWGKVSENRAHLPSAAEICYNVAQGE